MGQSTRSVATFLMHTGCVNILEKEENETIMDEQQERTTALLQEQYLERQSLAVCRSTTFVQSLKDYALAPSITVVTPRGKTLSITASSIWGARKRFFAHYDLDVVCPLFFLGERLAELYEHWLLNESTERYRFLTFPDHRQWLRRIVALIVVRHLVRYPMHECRGLSLS